MNTYNFLTNCDLHCKYAVEIKVFFLNGVKKIFYKSELSLTYNKLLELLH
jgi:hypothetical protein